MLLELSVADAYCGAFEYAPKSFIDEHNTGIYFSKHPRHSTPPGFYTDDTQMTLAIAEALLSDEAWTPYNLACRFLDVFKRDPRKGYAGGFYNFLKETNTGKEFLQNIKPTSDKSGAAMRTTPLGLLPDINDALEKTTIQAAITHNTKDGIEAAKAAMLLVFYFHKNISCIEDCGQWIDDILNWKRLRNIREGKSKEKIIRRWNHPWEGKVKTKGWMSVKAAITAVSRNTSLTKLLVDCASFTGDVDTVATIAMAAASVSIDYVKDLEPSLILGLENGIYGREYLEFIDRQLTEKYGETSGALPSTS
jgi:ADP-ribosylglycohydrolase